MDSQATTQARVLREKASYDGGGVWEASHRLQGRFHHVFACPNSLYGEQYFEERLAECCRGGRVLDYGCLDGGLAPKYRTLGAAEILGVDISEEGIARARHRFGDIGRFEVGDAHDMAFVGDGELDAVIGRAILHHLEFERAIAEIVRVLRPGGVALFVEPLFDNPASRIFRALTPKARTADERPLSRRQIEWADRRFSASEHRFCNLASTPVGMLTSLLPLSPDNPMLVAADRADRLLENTALRYWMRTAYLWWRK